VIAVLLVGIIVLLVLNMLKGSPAASPSPSSRASAPTASQAAPTSTGSQRPTSVPTSASTPPASPIASPSTPYEAFLLHIPESIRGTCLQGTAQPQTFVFNALCTSTDGFRVTYSQYADANGMDADYEQLFAQQQIDQDSGSCEDHATWPAESAYSVGGEPAGRRLCTDQDDLATITWTDDRVLILASAQSASADADALIEFWRTQAGPMPNAAVLVRLAANCLLTRRPPFLYF
jgi:hypothetical protein